MEQCAGRTDRSIRKMAVQGYLAGGPHHPARLEHIAHFVQAAGGNLEGFMQGDVTFLVFRYAIDGLQTPRPYRDYVYERTFGRWRA